MSELRRRLEEAEETLRRVQADLSSGSAAGLDRVEQGRCRLVVDRLVRTGFSVGEALEEDRPVGPLVSMPGGGT